jgi:uncharacterized repeat protein (TIGR03803 family)
MKLPRLSLLSPLAAAALAAHGAGVVAPNGDLLRAPDGAFYGVSSEGGANGHGTVFRVTPFSELSVLADFTGEAAGAKGSRPRAALVADGTLLWGTTQQGGAGNAGTVFKLDPATRVLTTVVEFSGADGAQPECALVADGAGFFWGTTRIGGAGGFGTIFKVDAVSGALTTVVEFTGTGGVAKGSQPRAALLRDGAGVFWGTTANGGALDLGTVFKFDPATSAFTALVEFTGTNGGAQGASPLSVLADDGAGSLWGTTDTGGSDNLGTIFKMDKLSGALTTIVHFAGANGANPKAGLLADGTGNLWSTTGAGGATAGGIVFRVNAATGALTTVADLSGTSGLAKAAFPFAGLAEDGAGNLWGSATKGGRDDLGTVFKISKVTGAFTLIVEPEPSPVAPQAGVQAPPRSATTGNAGDPITLSGVARDNLELVQVLISLNGAPFVPAIISTGARAGTFNWQLDVIPENGTNVVIVKSVDSGGNTSKPVTLFFNYTVNRPELAGNYNGLSIADPASGTPFTHTGAFSLRVLANGRFTGRLTLGGTPPVALTGAFGNDGTARFGRLGLTTLTIPRRNLPALDLALGLDVTAPFTRQVTGALRENAADAAALTGDQAIYTARRNPLPPLINMPATLNDPLTDKGAYTAIFAALPPATQGMPDTDFPQGDGYALMRVLTTGKVTLAGKLADGTPFSTASFLSQDNALPVFIRLQAGKASLAGFVHFRDQLATDADGTGLRWFKPANARAAAYRTGWPAGISVDFAASKFVPSRLTGLTALGNPPAASPTTANAVRETTHALGVGTLSTTLSINAGGRATDPAAPGVTANLFIQNGSFSGVHFDHGGALRVPHAGVVLQKSQTASGFFLIPPASAPRDPKQSGRVSVNAL